MTISLEEHVALAIWKARHTRKPYEVARAYEREGVACEARAAIAAMREREGDPAEAMRAKCEKIAMDYAERHGYGAETALDVADLIAALKGNGEGK